MWYILKYIIVGLQLFFSLLFYLLCNLISLILFLKIVKYREYFYRNSFYSYKKIIDNNIVETYKRYYNNL